MPLAQFCRCGNQSWVKLSSSASQPWTQWNVYGPNTEMSFPAMVLVLFCCSLLVVPVNKVHFFIWKLVIKGEFLSSLVGTGKRQDGMEWDLLPLLRLSSCGCTWRGGQGYGVQAVLCDREGELSSQGKKGASGERRHGAVTLPWPAAALHLHSCHLTPHSAGAWGSRRQRSTRFALWTSPRRLRVWSQ